MIASDFAAQLFQMTKIEVDALAIDLCKMQAKEVPIYKAYLDALHINVHEIDCLERIPFLPIQFFKSHVVTHSSATHIEQIFESSGTSGQINSQHHVMDVQLYESSFIHGFEQAFGEVSNFCILGLLPSYLERGSSSLVYMVNHLIQKSNHVMSGFYLHNHDALFKVIEALEAAHQPTLLFGVTYSLLDFSEKFKLPLCYVKIIETGGMKGRREELLREEVHARLQTAFSIKQIFAEYGMTELLSQAYALQEGIFRCSSSLRVMVREMNDPMKVLKSGRGLLNMIDLANVYSCAFIATDDVGEVFDDGTFKVTGRLDQSDLRGCSLMVAE
jgi:phenylacetate-coenzyme A ligase PaaK-like adenylate-forming protein